MKLALDNNQRDVLPYVDVFCDGTAVRQAGVQTFKLCQEFLDEVVTVNNDEICQAMRACWESARVIPEPSGAMGLAALLQDWDNGRIKEGEKCLVIISGANMDFSRLGAVAHRALERDKTRRLRYLRIPMETKRGQVLKYLRSIPEGIQLRDVQYGRVEGEMQYPVFGVYGTEEDFEHISEELKPHGYEYEDVTHDVDVRFRLIVYDRGHLSHPVFFTIEFPERPGSFLEFMQVMGEYSSLCYFNYQYSGENVGRALVGFEFETLDLREACRKRAAEIIGTTIQGLHELSPAVRRRVLGQFSDAKQEQS